MFVPGDFSPPLSLDTEHFHLHPLSTRDNDLDYHAVTHSMAYRGGEDAEVKSLSMEKNLENLARHEREFQERKAFAYMVLTPDKQKCLGCVYINPPSRGDFEAEVWMWVTVDAYKNGLDEQLYETVKRWIEDEWPFQRVVYPGRSMGWVQWDGLGE